MRLSCQMRNPFGKTRTFETALTLVAGDDGAFELAVGVVELGLVGNDALVEDSESHNVSLEPPIIHSLDCIKEGSVSSGRPLKGFMCYDTTGSSG